MFDLVTGNNERPLREQMFGPKVLSITVHVIIAGLVVVVPLLRVTNTLPPMPAMMAFVASEPPPPPPPPPPAAPAVQKVASKQPLNANTVRQSSGGTGVSPSEIGPRSIVSRQRC